MASTLQVISPVDGRIYAERAFSTEAEIGATLERARAAQGRWQAVPPTERGRILSRAIDAFVSKGQEIAEEITWQMGRPIDYAPKEVDGFEERPRYMIDAASDALADLRVGDSRGFVRFIRRMPLGVVLVAAPWNYPLLAAVNGVVPALVAGNAVILKHSAQTPLCAERFAAAFEAAGLPTGVFQYLHMDHAASGRLIQSGQIDFVSFTGSISGGHAVQEAAAAHLTSVGLELGGKDPAYVRADADLDHTIENLADGAFFNSGQSCCAIERIYVHQDVYERFMEGFATFVRGYRLDDPTSPGTTLGPLATCGAADFVRDQTSEAVAQGAIEHIDRASFPQDIAGSAYMAPQVLSNVDHSMRVMTEETFGPVVGVIPVSSDDEAIRLMNDSRYGLTASIWTRDLEVALWIGDQVEVGTWFMNRCDYLDPALAWTGIKDSGRGCSLSRLQYEHLTRPKSFHLRVSS